MNPPRNGFHVLGKRKSRSDGGWNTHRKPVGALLSHCAVAPRVTLWTQTAASLSSLLQGLKTHLSGAATLLLPSRHLIPAFRLCRPCQEFPVQNSESDLCGSEGGGGRSLSQTFTYRLSFGPRAPRASFRADLSLSGDTTSVVASPFSTDCSPPPKKSRLSLTISPFGPLNPCGPFSPASPWRRQIKHTQLFTDGPGPSQPGRRYYKILE